MNTIYSGDGVVQTPNMQASASLTFAESAPGSRGVPERRIYRNDYIRNVEMDAPSIIQNSAGFPRNLGYDSRIHRYRYDYYMDYSDMNIPAIYKSLNLDVRGRRQLYNKYMENYNRYKLVMTDDVLAKSFSHVFFIKPDCNIYDGSGALLQNLRNNPDFYYASQNCPELLNELTQQKGANHEFMMLLSNKAETFDLKDEYIKYDSYGQGLTGYKVPYGKNDVESKSDSTFSVKYTDDRDLHVYRLHKLWMDYIAYVYRGRVSPTKDYVMNKILDYPICVYFIMTAEDGETIIFWSKYWGVFPVNAPSSQFSFARENAGGVHEPQLNIEYQYAWKEDFNPLTLVEFNQHSAKLGNYRYTNTFQSYKIGTGYTWSGAPFIETMRGNTRDLRYTFKLRFRPA